MNPWEAGDIRRKIGRFVLGRDVVEELGFTGLHVLQSTCLIRHMERMWERDATIYYAWNPTFDLVPEGDITPWYDLEIDRDPEDPNTIGFRFVKSPDQAKEPRL